MSGLINKVITNGSVIEVGRIPEGDNKYSSVNILVINPKNDADVNVRAYATFQDSPTLVDTIDYRAVLVREGGRVNLSCEIMSPGERIFIDAPAGLVVRLTSVDEDQ